MTQPASRAAARLRTHIESVQSKRRCSFTAARNEVASKLGVSGQTLSNLMAGRHMPGLAFAVDLAALLKVPVGALAAEFEMRADT